jgi:hydroxypyruvate isomerase
MPRFAANLSLLYNEHAFLDRFAEAAADGFTGVECQFPYDHPADEIAARLAAHGLQQVLFNAPPGHWAAGERGLAALPGRESEFRRGFEQALAYAERLACPRIHVMAGLWPAGQDPAPAWATYEANLAWAAAQAASAGRHVLIEPINPFDMPGYLLNRQADAHALVRRLALPNLKVQFDLYHAQRVEGGLPEQLHTWLPSGRVGHLQIAGVPGRHEPDVGDIDFGPLFDLIDQLADPALWVGCEYRPRRSTREGLGWLQTAGFRR